MEMDLQEIVESIKQEPEEHFWFKLPDYQESKEESCDLLIRHTREESDEAISTYGSELCVKIKKFDASWNIKVKLFETYFVCEKCDFVANRYELNKHSQNCEGNKRKFVDRVLAGYCRAVKERPEQFVGTTWQCHRCGHNTQDIRDLKFCCRLRFSCETCNKRFDKPWILLNHQVEQRHGIHATPKNLDFECNECGKTFSNTKSLYFHKFHYHGEMRFHCVCCGKSFKTELRYKLHMSNHTKNPCPVCNKPISDSRIKRHLKMHESSYKTILTCNIQRCPQKFSSIKHLNEHQSIHIGKNHYKCPTCNYEAKSLHVIMTHIKFESKRISEKQNFHCHLCGKTFKAKHNMRRHMDIHLKVPCSVCRKPIEENYMKNHMKSLHSSGKSFLACQIPKCQQKFSTVEQQNEHQSFHIGEQRYKCPTCNYEARCLNDMNKHVKFKSTQCLI